MVSWIVFFWAETIHEFTRTRQTKTLGAKHLTPKSTY